MRSHRVAGVGFLLLGVALLAAGLLGGWTPAFLEALPLPATIVMPFVLWQLAVWSLLFGVFFLRPRARARPKVRMSL